MDEINGIHVLVVKYFETPADEGLSEMNETELVMPSNLKYDSVTVKRYITYCLGMDCWKIIDVAHLETKEI